MADPKTEEMRVEQLQREHAERDQADDATDSAEEKAIGGAPSAPRTWRRSSTSAPSPRRKHEQHSEPERDVEEMEERSERLGDEIDGAREDWQRKQADSSVPAPRVSREESDADVEFDPRDPKTRIYSATPSGGYLDASRAVGDRADPARAGVVCGEQGGGGVPVEAGTTAQKPQPMLKTSHISASATAPSSLDELEDGRDRQRVGDLESDGGVQARQVQQPAAGDVREAVDAETGPQQLERRADVDRRRLEQGVGHRGTAQRRRAVVQRERGERGAGQRVAVGVQPGRRDADQRVAGVAVGSGDDLSSATCRRRRR